MNLRYVLGLQKAVANTESNLCLKTMKKFLLNWREAVFLDSLSLILEVLGAFVWFVTLEDLNDMAMLLEVFLVPCLILLIKHSHYQYSFIT